MRLIGQARDPLVEGEYLHWDELRHRTPPAGLTLEQWWLTLKFARQGRRFLPLEDPAGRQFSYALPDPLLERLARIDREGSGHVAVPGEIASPSTRDRYLQSSIMEEAITSSLLEGAATTREEAREMIRSGRSPVSDGERMVLGNYRAMEWIRTRVDAPLTPQTVFDLHRVLMVESDPEIAGRLRDGSKPIVVEDRRTGEVLHRPPPAAELSSRLEAMCAFANAPTEAGAFVHPVVRSILLTSGSRTITRSRTETAGPPGPSSTGPCVGKATGSSSSLASRRCCGKRPRSTPGRSSLPRRTTST